MNLCEDCNACCTILRIDKKFLTWRDTDKNANEMCDQLVNDQNLVEILNVYGWH